MFFAAVALAATTLYPAMAPLAKYLMAPADEIVFARSAAPDAISKNAEVQVLTASGYKVAVKGTNGFVCLAERSWDNPFDDPEFWNTKIRTPQCFNAAAARSVLPEYLARTRWVLAGIGRVEVMNRLKAAVASREIGEPQTGSMVYMLSKQQYINDAAAAWHPHLMFFYPRTAASAFGADMPGTQIYSATDAIVPSTVFFVPVSKWSDGTPYVAPAGGHHHHH
jgi:hypothetical protein